MKLNRTKFAGATFALIAASLPACSGNISEGESIGTQGAELYQEGTHWSRDANHGGTGLGADVHVCYDVSAIPATPAAVRTQAITLAANVVLWARASWGAVADINFIDEQACGANRNGKLVLKLNVGGGTDCAFYQGAGSPTTMNLEYSQGKVTVLHEVGHALGFSHEFERSDWIFNSTVSCNTDSDCTEAPNDGNYGDRCVVVANFPGKHCRDSSTTGTKLTSVDFDSMMAATYTLGNQADTTGKLSANDIAGVQSVYGVRPELAWTNWFQVAGTTGRPLASTTFANRLYLFASGNGSNNDIYANSALAQQAFGGWGPIGGQTDVPVGGAAFDSRLYLFTKGVGANHAIYFNFALDQQPFNGWQAIGGSTDKAIAVTTFDSRIYLFAKGDGADHRIYLNNALAQQPFSGWNEVGGRTDEALTATVFDGKLYIFAKNEGTNAYSGNWAAPQQPFAGWFGIPSTLKAGVTPRGALASATYNGRVYLAARGSDSRLYVNSALPQQAFGSWVEIPGGQTTNASPTMTVFDNRLYVAIKLADKRIFAVNATPFVP